MAFENDNDDFEITSAIKQGGSGPRSIFPLPDAPQHALTPQDTQNESLSACIFLKKQQQQ